MAKNKTTAEAVQDVQKKKKSKNTESTPTKSDVSADEWQEMLDDLGSESNDPRMYFIKNGRNRIKLVPEGGDPKKFFTSVTRTYQGEARTKFIIRGIVLSKDGETPAIKGITVGKTVIKQILNLLAEGYDLFGEKTGLGITIVKSGSGLEGTGYNTLPSPAPVAMPKKFVDLDISLADLSKEIAEADRKRSQEMAKNGRGGRGTARLGKKKSEEKDEDWD